MNKSANAAWVVLLLFAPLCPAFDGPQAKGLDRLIRDLGSDRYAIRKQAEDALEKMGDVAGPALHKALEKPLSLEAQTRVAALVARRARFHHDQAQAKVRAEALPGLLLRAFAIIEKNHVIPTTFHQLTVWSIEGMYQEAKRPVPQAIRARLDKLARADKKALGDLLREVRVDLGVCPQMEGDRDLDICFRAVFARLEPGATPASGYIRPEKVRRMYSN